MRPNVTAGGSTLAHLGGNYTLNAPSVTVTASAPDVKATTQTFSLNIGAVAVSVASNPVTANHETDAFVAPNAKLTVNAPLTLHATSGNTATTSTQSLTIGAVQVDFESANTNVAGGTMAYVGSGAVLKGQNISLLADSTNNASAEQDSVGLSFVGAVKLDPVATDQHTVQAYVSSGSTVTGNTLTVSATENNSASATSNGTQGSLIGLADVHPQAIAEGDTIANIAGTITAGLLNVTATANRNAQSTASVLSINIAGGGSALADAQVHGNTLAELASTGVLNIQGNATFQATSNPTTNASATGGGGGVINGSALDGHHDDRLHHQGFCRQQLHGQLCRQPHVPSHQHGDGWGKRDLGKRRSLLRWRRQRRRQRQARRSGLHRQQRPVQEHQWQPRDPGDFDSRRRRRDFGGLRRRRGLLWCGKLDREQQSDGQCVYWHRIDRQREWERHDLGDLGGSGQWASAG